MWHLLSVIAAVLFATSSTGENHNVWVIVGLLVLAEFGWWMEKRKLRDLNRLANVGDENFSKKYQHLDKHL